MSNGELAEFGLRGLDSGGVEGGIQLCRHSQSGSGCGGADELESLFVSVERFSRPVPADLAEQTVLDGVPFGGSGRVVRKSDAQAQTIAQLTLNLVFQAPRCAPLLPPVSARMRMWLDCG